MRLTFIISGDCTSTFDHDTHMNLDIRDGLDLLEWLGFERTDFLYLTGGELEARCRRRLWPISRNFDAEQPPRLSGRRQGTVEDEYAGRPKHFLRSMTEVMLKLAMRAGREGVILSLKLDAQRSA